VVRLHFVFCTRASNLGALSADRVGAAVVDIGGCIESAIL
jgi:hypothetical protein